MHKRTIHAVLGDLIALRGISPTELSRQTGVPQPTISRILNRKIESPSDKHVSALASYFGVTTDQMHGRQQLPDPAVAERKPLYELHPVTVWDDESPLDDDEVELPFLKEVEVSAGSGRTVITESGSRKMRFGKWTMRNRGVDPANAVCVLVSGNSMEPVLRNGATVGIDRGATRVVDGDMYAIDHAGQLRVKQLYRLPGGGLRLRSFNRDEHPDEDYTADQVDAQIRILGRVWWGAMFF